MPILTREGGIEVLAVDYPPSLVVFRTVDGTSTVVDYGKMDHGSPVMLVNQAGVNGGIVRSQTVAHASLQLSTVSITILDRIISSVTAGGLASSGGVAGTVLPD